MSNEMAIKPKRILTVELINITQNTRTRQIASSRLYYTFFSFALTVDGVAAMRSVVCRFLLSNVNGDDYNAAFKRKTKFYY